jgi:pimeloyl-ACP methyl ester carboxylesterase
MSSTCTKGLRACALVSALFVASACSPGDDGAGGAERSARAPQPPAAITLADAPDRFVTDDDLRLRYREIGQGDVVVLLHGFGGNLLGMTDLADFLAARTFGVPGFRVVGLDQRGFGQSSKFDDPARYGSEMGEDVIRLLDHLGVERVHIAGQAMGGLVASYVAIHYPERIATVSIVGAPFFENAEQLWRVFGTLLEDLRRGDGMHEGLRVVFPTWSDDERRAFGDALLANNDAGALIAALQSFDRILVGRRGAESARVPALIVAGTDDPLMAQARDLAAWWPNARLVEVQDADHLHVIQRPELLDAVRAHAQSNPVLLAREQP